MVGGVAGTTSVAVQDGSGIVLVTCVPNAPPPPPGPLPDPLGYEALPVTGETVLAAIQPVLAFRHLDIPGICNSAGGVDLGVNCGGVIGVDVTPVHVTVSKVNALTFEAKLRFGLAASSPLHMTAVLPPVLNESCPIGFNSAGGASPFYTVAANFAFSPRIPGVVVNRLHLDTLTIVDRVEPQDITLGSCGIAGELVAILMPLVMDTFDGYAASMVASAIGVNYCGAPGPDLFTNCP